jgi:L-fuconate dehydratase
MVELIDALRNLRIRSREWGFSDLRIDIPPMSFGSDAANPHTQYSNAVARIDNGVDSGIGATFTLGEGNQFICEGAKYIVAQLDGLTVGEIMDSQFGFAEALMNPLQLRWLSPYAGVPMMASGLIVNTVLDIVSKRVGLPAWEFMARLKADDLASLMGLRHLGGSFDRKRVLELLRGTETSVAERCSELRLTGLPVYFTTWIGHDSSEIAKQALYEIKSRGIRQFKLKVSPDFESDTAKLAEIRRLLPNDVLLCVDANQTLTFQQATRWIRELSRLGVVWLEEPFAPDNTLLFSALTDLKRAEHLQCEIVTGENCPNIQTASALVAAGIDRYQADPCRMMGLVDGLATACIAKIGGAMYTPHAGGAGLDEMSLHLQLLNLARVDAHRTPSTCLTENVGFSSRFYRQPAVVIGGKAEVPIEPGLLVGFTKEVEDLLIPQEEGISWVTL